MTQPRAGDGHVLLLHTDESERRESLAEWVRHGLAAGEKVVCAEPEDQPPDHSLLSVLEQQGVDGASAKGDGRLTLLPPRDFYPAGIEGRLLDQALAEGFHGLRTSVDVRAALTFMSSAEHLRVERRLEEMCGRGEWSALCLYDRQRARVSDLSATAAAHLNVRARPLLSYGSADRLALKGDVDPTNQDVLDAVVKATVRRAGRRLHIDLADVDFLDSRAALTLLVATEEFRQGGGTVTLGSPTARVERILVALGIGHAPGIELLGADYPITRVEQLCRLCLEATGVTGVALGINSGDIQSTVYATNEVSDRLEDLQLTLSEGPSVEAARKGWPVLVPDLSGASDDRWPWFAPAAREAGARAMFALPVQVGAIRLGVLVLYRNTPGSLTTDQLNGARALAEAASILLTLAEPGDQSAEQFLWVLNDRSRFRAEVHQAVGVTMVHLGVAPRDALARVCAHAYASGRAIGHVADDIVARRLRLEPD